MRFFQLPVVLLLAVSAFAQDVTPSSGTKQPAPPWEVSTADRLRERFDPDAMRARLDAQRATVRHVKDGMWPISGKTHAHLFFPWELLDRFLRESRAEMGRSRAAYADDITDAGWDVDGFWAFIDTIGADHEAADAAYAALPADKRRGPEGTRLRHVLCVERADALRRAREHFGEQAFDRFLYTAVGQHLVMWSDGQRSADLLARVEAGCR